MKSIEIEIKVTVERSASLVAFLESNARPLSSLRQIDTYYTPPDRNFVALEPVVEWLRLREEEGKDASINYKHWHYENDGKSHHCDEFESSLGNVQAMREMLRALGFRPLTTVDKFRRTWLINDYEVALDAVKGLGDFVEIEYKGMLSDSLDPATITAQMEVFLAQHNCGKITRDYRGYPYLLLFPK